MADPSKLPYKLQYMAAQGRAPSFDSTGSIRGFRSRPGAPLSDRDSMSGLGINAVGSPDHAASWRAFFPKMSQLAPVTTGAAGDVGSAGAENVMGADEANTLTNPSVPAIPTTPAQNVAASISQNAAYLQNKGVSFAPPPTIRDDSMPPEPWMPMGPGAKMQMPKMADTYSGLLEQNKALVAPGGMAGMLQLPRAKTYPTGWQITGADEAANIRKRYSM